MLALLAGLLGLLGLLVGSFLNVVIHRVPRRESIVSPGSRCPGCGTPVAPRDNVPVLSWLLLRGRCRHCGVRVSARYPLVELLTGVVFAAVVLARGPGLHLLLDLPFAAMLIAVGGIDLEHRIVPNRIVVPAAVYGLVGLLLVRFDDTLAFALAGLGAFAFLLLAALAYPAGMGMGDVKLAGVMGLFLGLAVVPAMFAAFVAGSVLGLALMVRYGARARKMGVPFGPFLAAGGVIALLVGPELVALYADTFLT